MPESGKPLWELINKPRNTALSALTLLINLSSELKTEVKDWCQNKDWSQRLKSKIKDWSQRLKSELQ